MRKLLFVLLLIGTPLIAMAQLHSSVYDQNQRKCITLNTRADNTIESVSLIGTDLTTFTFDEEGKLAEAVNSLATVEIMYDDDKAKATATVDGGKLEYLIDAKHIEGISMKELKRQNQFLRGNKLSMLEQADKFLCQGGGKLLLDIADQTLNIVNKSIDNCFAETSNYISRAIHGVDDDKEEMMNNLKTMQDVLRGETSITNVVKDKTIGAIFEDYPSWSDKFAEKLYEAVSNHRKAQKEQNAKKNAWKAGLLDAVSKGELSMEMASEIISKVEVGEMTVKDSYDITIKDIVKNDVPSMAPSDGKFPASNPNVPLTFLSEMLKSKGLGVLNKIEIQYFGHHTMMGNHGWRRQYVIKKGKYILDKDQSWDDECTEHCEPAEYPYYLINIYWMPTATSSIHTYRQIYLSPFGKIIKMQSSYYGRNPDKLCDDVWEVGDSWTQIKY